MAIVLYPSLDGSGAYALHDRLIGDSAACGAAFVLALYAFLYNDLNARDRAPPPDSVILTTFLIGTLALVPLSIPSGIPALLADGSSSAVYFLLIGIVSTALPTIGVTIASQRLPSVVAATINIPTPVLAGLFAYLVLGEAVSSFFVPGAVLVLVGVTLIVLGTRRPGIRRAAVSARME